ncbi:O-antigen ligase family protein [Bacteroidales bacterium OttesenSCG-928-L03]|nr:O-antigen ligase family protein [Bacteroidales bacterium OttesenSCG-928-L03]
MVGIKGEKRMSNADNNIFKFKKGLMFLLNLLCVLALGGILSTVFQIGKGLENGLVSGKYFWFYAWMGIASITIILSYSLNRNPVRWQMLDALVLLFGVISLFFSYLANQEINTKWILLLLCLILYFYFRIALSGSRLNRYFLIVCLLLTGCVEAIWGLLQLYDFLPSQHSLFRITGSFFNPGPYSGYLAVITPLAFYYILTDYRVLKRTFSIRLLCFYIRWGISTPTLLCIVIILPAAMSRAAWLAVIGGSSIVALVYTYKRYKLQALIRQNKKRAALIGMIIVLLLVLGAIGMYNLKKDSADGRVLMWKISQKAIPSHPFGVGLNHFSGAYGDVQAEYFESGMGTEQEEYVAGGPEYAFNEYLQICLELGIIPFLLFCTILFLTFFRFYQNSIRRRQNLSLLGVVGSLVAILVFAFMSYPFSVLPFVSTLVFLWALCATNDNKKMTGKKKSRVITPIVLLLSFIIVILCLINRYPTYSAYQKWNKVKTLYHLSYYQEAEPDYRELFPCLRDKTAFLFEYGQVLRKIGRYEQSNEILKDAIQISCDPMLYNLIGQNYQALEEYDLAETALLRAGYLAPSRHYPYYLLAKLYVEKGDFHQAKEMAEFVIAKEPKIPSSAINEIKTEMRELLDNLPIMKFR